MAEYKPGLGYYRGPDLGAEEIRDNRSLGGGGNKRQLGSIDLSFLPIFMRTIVYTHIFDPTLNFKFAPTHFEGFVLGKASGK